MTSSSKPKKEFKLSSLAVNNHRTVILLAILIFFSGVAAYVAMPKENFPELNIPTIYVGTPYPGNSPKVIEDKISRPIEKEISTITGVDKITSTSIQDYSTIVVEFDFDLTVDEALRKVKDAVDKAKSDKDFPQDLPADPNVFELNFAEFPIMNINLSGNFSVDQLKVYGEYLEDKIENLEEISKVEIRGTQEKELEIALNRLKAEAMEVSLQDVENAVTSENLTMSGGELLLDNVRRTIRVEGEFSSAEELGNIIVKQEKGNLIYLKDIATVSFGDKETESYAREFQKPVVMLDIIKRSGKNLLDASDKINEILAEAKANYLPENLEITVTNDQSNATREQVANLENSIIFGILLVVGVLLFFLGIRNALFVGVAIPLSMFMAFMILNSLGVTLNVMVLFSLVLALGMLVDNGIVVVENIYRLMDEEGLSRIEASKKGVGEVAVPIIASTATTLAAFFPLAVWPGMMGEFMKYLPITLIIVLGSSLFVGLVINPVLTSLYMKVEGGEKSSSKWTKISMALIVFGVLMLLAGVIWLANLAFLIAGLSLLTRFVFKPGTKRFQEGVLPKLEERYSRFLNYALEGRKPRKFFLGTIGLLLASFVFLGMFTPKVLFFPENEPLYVNVFVSAPIGTDIERTNEITKSIEKQVTATVKKYEEESIDESGITHSGNFLIESIIAQVGQGASDPNEGPSMSLTPNKGRVTISFVEFMYRRGISTSDVMEEIREGIKDIPADVQITVAKNAAGPPMPPPINIEVTGDDYDELVKNASELKSFIARKNIAGIDELKLDVDLGKPELPIQIDRMKARAYNLSTYKVASQIRTALFGKEISTFKQGEDDYPINLRYLNSERYNLDNLLTQKITFRDAATGKISQVPISTVLQTPKKTSTYSAVKRKDQKRMITLFSNVVEGYNPNEVVGDIQAALSNFEFADPNYGYKFTGQQEDQEKEMAFLMKALLIAVFLIFLILVSQFNSAFTPAIIITAVGLSLIGVFLGLVIFQMDFIIIMTMIGIISLAGIVVNNAIVLIDYANLLITRRREELQIEEGTRLPMPELISCIEQAGKTRLRPVLLTAITTVLGLLPLALGLNIDFVKFFTSYDANIYMGGDNVMFFGPMSWTIIFGLTFATFLTLVIVPVMYLLLKKIQYRLNIF